MPLRAALLALTLLAPLLPAGSAAAADVPRQQTALVVFVAAGPAALAAGPGLSAGIMSATQGECPPAQLALDAGAGSRVGCVEYDRPLRALALLPRRGGRIDGWPAALARARAAPQVLVPGLLAQRAGGAAYSGPPSGPHLGAILAANRSGQIAATALVAPSRVAAAAQSLLRRHRLVVADLPRGRAGVAQLGTLLRARRTGELLLAVQQSPGGSEGELVWAGAAGLAGGGDHALSSSTTEQRGMIAATDLAPTVLDHLGLPIPAAMLGRAMFTSGPLSRPELVALERRLRVIPGRRPWALATLLGSWLLLSAVGVATAGARGRAWALRVGALAVLWLPAASLLPAALEPSAGAEYALLAGLCIAFAAASDRLLAWPRAPIAPAVVTLLALTTDALAGTGLLLRALPGPDPLGGVRFHGIGNELKSALAVMVLVAVAAAGRFGNAGRFGDASGASVSRSGRFGDVSWPVPGHGVSPGPASVSRSGASEYLPGRPGRRRGPRAAVWLAAAGIGLAAVEGSARIGAGVGGAILVSFAFAVACATALGGTLTRRRLLTVLLAPAAGLASLAALDLLTAGGTGHFSTSVLHARSIGDLWHVVVRHYGGAWRELANGPMAAATALALVGSVLAAARPERLLGALASDRVWSAAVRGGVAAGIAGSLVEDSGPLLLLVALFTLICVGAYARGVPSVAARYAFRAQASPRAAESAPLLAPGEGIA